MNSPNNYYNKIIVALDTSDLNKIKFILKELAGYTKIFKVGLQLFTLYGSDIVKRVQDAGYDVFLDLKFFDIPNTVEKAVQSAILLDVKMITVHTLGGIEMMKRAADLSRIDGKSMILGVTILTSMDDNSLKELSFSKGTSELVPLLATCAQKSGVHGVISSPLEIEAIRNNCGKDFLIVTPGIRLTQTFDDQKRVLTPKEAFNKGADFIVIGRPILEADDPVKIIESIKE
jgi:orotidine-5'-phosphate decarboxylase